MAFYVYEYRDPTRGNAPIYVGKGKGERAWAHLNPLSRIGHVIKRCRDAGEREMLLIRQYGREDTGTGTLLNRTDGGGRTLQPCSHWKPPFVVEVYTDGRLGERIPTNKKRKRRRKSRKRLHASTATKRERAAVVAAIEAQHGR